MQNKKTAYLDNFGLNAWNDLSFYLIFFVSNFHRTDNKKRKSSLRNSVRIQSYFGPHFPAFGTNTERYSQKKKKQPYFCGTAKIILESMVQFNFIMGLIVSVINERRVKNWTPTQASWRLTLQKLINFPHFLCDFCGMDKDVLAFKFVKSLRFQD